MDNDLAPQITERLTKPVVLIGMMGSGKSHIGRLLAQALGLDFVDTDHEIEKRAGCSVSEIFERDGEDKFRAAEKNVIEELLSGEVCVMATGGGAITSEQTANAIWSKAVSVWLSADISTLMERLKDKEDRPLLACGGPHEILERLLDERRDIYQKADIIVDSGNAHLDKTLQDVLKALDGHLNEDHNAE